MNSAQELLICGFEYIKQYHSLYPKEFIEEALMVAPGRVVIVLECKALNEVKHMAMAYHYFEKTIQHFIATKDSGLRSHPNNP